MIHAILLAATAAIAADRVPEGWQTTVDANAAVRAAQAYTGGVVRCVWAGDDPNTVAAMPANVAFQFAVAGDEWCVTNVQKILDATVAAFRPDTLKTLRDAQMLGPTMQWLIRYTKPGVTSNDLYLQPTNHPPAFAERDFDLATLTNVARQLRPQIVPPVVMLEMCEEIQRKRPIDPPEPGVDYPGIRGEVNFMTPFGVALVLRSPEYGRTFRFKATTWPKGDYEVAYRWVVIGGGAWVGRWGQGPEKGFGEIRLDRRSFPRNGRVDVAVFAQIPGGLWSAPSIISFYLSPYEARTYAKDGKLQRIQYLPEPAKPLPYDISPICLPAEWTDYYQYSEGWAIFGFSRMASVKGAKSVDFSNFGEVVIERHPNETPKITHKVRYFEKDGQLRWEETGEAAVYKLESFRMRR